MTLRSVLMAAAGGDNTPNAFDFTNVTGVNPSTATQSNIVTISGITGAVLVSGTGGVQFSINGDAFSSTQRTIQNNQTLQLQVTSATFSTQVSTTVTVGDTTDTWNVTTRAADTTPAAFSFTDTTGVEPNTVTTSGTITVSGLEPNFTHTVSISGPANTGVDAGTSALSGTFALSKNVTSSATGTIVVAARVTSSVSFSSAVNATVTIGGVTDTYTVTTRAADTEPNAFTNAFTDVTGAEPNTQYTSNTITISGLEPNYTGITVSATGGTIDAGTSSLSGTYAASKTNLTTSATGTIVVAARVTPTLFGTAYPVVVTCGTQSDTYTVTTRAADTTGTMTFVDQTGVNLNTLTTSTTITASGFEPNYTFTVTCTGGEIDAGTTSLTGTFATSKSVTTSGTGTFVIAARATSSVTFGNTVNVVVTAGNTSDTFSITTKNAAMGTFTFTDVTGLERSTESTSATVTATGFEPNTTFTVSGSGGTVDAGISSLSGTFAATKTVTSSGTGTFVLAARVTTGPNFLDQRSNTVTVTPQSGPGSSSDTYTTTVRAADTVGTMSFVDQTGVDPSTLTQSATITASNFEPNASLTITCTGGEIDAGTTALSGTFATSKSITTSGTGTFVIAARATSSATFLATVNVVITVGSTSDTFSITTRNALIGTYTFTSQTNLERNVTATSTTVTATGFEPNGTYNITASGGTVDVGTTTLSGTFAASKSVTASGTGTFVLAARVTTSTDFNTGASVGVNAQHTTGGTSAFGSFAAFTRVADLTANAFSFTDATGVNLSTLTTSNTITIGGLEPNFSHTITASGGGGVGVDAGTTALSGTFAASKTVTSTGSGTIVAAVRANSSSSFSTAVNNTVVVNSLTSDTYTITTRAADEQPDAFSFSSTGFTAVNPNTTTTYAGSVTITGLEPNFNITVSTNTGTVDAGTSSLSGTFAASKVVTTSGTGTIVVAPRVTSSSSFGASVVATITVGTGQGTWTVTTRNPTLGTIPSFTDNMSAEINTQYTSNTVTATGFEPNTTFTLNPWLTANGTIDGGTTTLSGTFASTKTITTSGTGTFVVALRRTSASSFQASVNLQAQATWTGGGSTASSPAWTILTRAQDITPTPAVTIPSATSRELNTVTTSSTVTVQGIEPSQSITVNATNGTVDAGTTTLSGTFAASKTVTATASGTIVIAARGTSSSSYFTGISVSLTIGGGSAFFYIETRPQALGTIPTPTAQTGLERNTTYTSNTVTATGFDPNTTYTITTSLGSVDTGTSTLSGTFVSATKTVTTSGTGTFVAAFRGTSSVNFSTAVTTDIRATRTDASNVSTSPVIFSLTTRAADTTPNSFTNAFTDQTGREISTSYVSNTITISGLEPSYTGITVSATGGTVDAGTSALSGTFASSKTGITTSASGTIVVAARGTSSGAFTSPQDVVVTCGGQSDTFRITTRDADIEPDPWTFTDLSNQEVNTLVYLGGGGGTPVTIGGLEPSIGGHTMSFVATVPSVSQYNINSIGWTTITNGALVNFISTNSSGQFTLGLRLTTFSGTNDTRSIAATVGSITRTWNVSTYDAIPDAFSFGSNVTNARAGGDEVSGGLLPGVYETGTITITGLAPSRTITFTNPCAGTSTADVSGLYFGFGTTSVAGYSNVTTALINGGGGASVTTTASGTCVLRVGVSAAGTSNTTRSITMNLNGVTSSFSVTTGDGLPDAFSFTGITGAAPSTTYTSDTVTLTGMTPNFPIAVQSTGGGLVDAGTSALSGSFSTVKSVTTSGTGTAVVACRQTTGSALSSQFITGAKVGMNNGGGSVSETGVTGNYSVTTRSADVTVSNFINDRVEVSLNSVYTMPATTFTGVDPNLNADVSFSFQDGRSSLYSTGTGDAGTSALSGTFASIKSITTSGTGTFVAAARTPVSMAYNTTAYSLYATLTSGSVSDSILLRRVLTPVNVAEVYALYTGLPLQPHSAFWQDSAPGGYPTPGATIPTGFRTFVIRMTNVGASGYYLYPGASTSGPEYSWDGSTYYPSSTGSFVGPIAAAAGDTILAYFRFNVFTGSNFIQVGFVPENSGVIFYTRVTVNGA